ncbi:MAG: tryptophan synthase subunit alpha [Desulfobacterales bacterium]|nr:tryptophan synthase subunit alpha [Desulfobacterales bacterium]
MLESYLKQRKTKKDILLMTHIVLGYPTFRDSHDIIAAMVAAGVDLMELQIPFSEPIADGPVILHANQKALTGGATVQKCLDFSREITREFAIPFLFMSYYNILYKFGVQRFASEMALRGLRGAIVPDLPPEEGREYLAAMENNDLSPIFIFSPTTPAARMQYLASFGRGFIYCVARKGVTGNATDFSENLEHYLARCRTATRLPLALGFGVKEKSDVDFLKGKVDIAVIGTQTIRLVDREGPAAVGEFIQSLC